MASRAENLKRFVEAWEAWAALLEVERARLQTMDNKILAGLENGDKIRDVARELAIAEVFGPR